MLEEGTNISHGAAYDAGYVTGGIIFTLLLVFLAIKCFSIARRPATQTLCAVSLGVLFSAYALCSVLVMAARRLPPSMATLCGILSGLLILGAIMATVTLAIIGLVDYARNKTLYQQGRAQAVTAIVLSGVFMLGVITVALQRIITAGQRVAVAAEQPRADEWLRFADLNFQFQTPGGPWVQLDAKKLNATTTLAFTRNFPSVSFAIVAENLGDDTLLNETQVVEMAKANLRLNVKSVSFLRESPLQLHDLRGTQFEFETQTAQLDIFYTRWIIFTNGYAYHMTAWGRHDQAGEVRNQAAGLFSRFALINPKRIASGNSASVKKFKSARYGYEMNLAGSDWFPSPTLSRTVPVADFGVVNSRNAGFYVIPVLLDGHKPRIEALTSSLLALVKISYPGDETAPPKNILHGGLEGLQLDCEREDGTGRRQYRTQILQGKDVAYLFVSWKLVKDGPNYEDLDEPFRRLQFSEPAPSAPSTSSSRKVEKERQGFVFNEIGLFFYRAKQYDQSIAYFKAALEWQDDSEVYLENIVQAYDASGKSTEALACLDAHASLVAQNPGLRAEQAHLQEQAGQSDRALTNYAAVFSEGYVNDDHFADYFKLLGQARERTNVLAEVQKYLKHRDSPAVRLLEASLYKQNGEFARAIDLLKSQREKFPFNLELTASLVDAYYLAGLYKESIDLCDQAAASGADSAYLDYLKGRSEYGLKRYREAKTSFESALKKAPASSEVKQFLDHVSAMLGEGSNSSLKEPIAAVAIPARLTNAPLAAAPPGYDKDYGAEYLRQITAVSYEKDKELKRTEYWLVKVLDAGGVSKFSTIQFSFDPLSEQMFVNNLRVIDAEGKTVSTGSVADYYVVDDTQTQMADQKKILNIPVSGLQPGHTIELTVTRRDLAPPKTFRFYSRVFCSTSPVRQDALFLSGDVGSVKFQSTLTAAPQKDADGICWVQDNSPIYHWEPYQQPASEFLPTVNIGDASATWDGEVRDYLEAIGDRLQLDADQRELARKLVQKATNETERIQALAAYVQTNYTYKAIEFGRRARVPQKTSEIVRNRYGDCKDHALLLQQMLEATGTPARLALVNPGSPVVESLPSLDQFTHMIVYLPQYDRGFFIDCTYKDSALAVAAPMGLAGRKALILDQQHPALANIPEYPADSSSVRSARQLRLTNQTDVLVHETLTFRGYYAGFMRSYLEKLPPPSRRDFLNEQMNHPGLEITHLEIKNLEDTRAPLLFEMDYLVKRQFQALGNQIIGQMPDIWEHHYLWTDPAENRLTAFQLAFPLSLESTVTVEVPEGYSTPATEGFEQDLHQPFATGRTTAQNQGSRMVINYSLHRPSGTFAPTEYAAFRKSMDQALGPLEQNMAFSKIAR